MSHALRQSSTDLVTTDDKILQAATNATRHSVRENSYAGACLKRKRPGSGEGRGIFGSIWETARPC